MKKIVLIGAAVMLPLGIIAAVVGGCDEEKGVTTPTVSPTQPSETTATPYPTPVPTVVTTSQATVTPTLEVTQEELDAWLAEEVAAVNSLLEPIGAEVFDSIFTTPTIIWLQTRGLDKTDAEGICKAIVGDYKDRFGRGGTVRVFGPTGEDLLARCTS